MWMAVAAALLAASAAGDDDLSANLQRVRRHIHAAPELSGEEHATRAFLRGEFERAGFTNLQDMADTGLRVVYDTGRPGPVVAFRAELDALPIAEKTGLPFSSQSTGVMHACGHDLHAAIVFGAALAIRRDADFHGQFVFLFQPAEEGSETDQPVGAARMIADGALTKPAPDYIFALHLAENLGVGEVGVRPGLMMAAAEVMEIDLRAEPFHPSVRDHGVDVFTLVSDTLRIQEEINKDLSHGDEEAFISITKIHGGSRFNVTPEHEFMAGTVRAVDEVQLAALLSRFSTAVASNCEQRGGSVEIRHHLLSPPVINDESLTATCMKILERAGFDVVDAGPLLAADDFARYAQIVPSVYFLLGASEQGQPAGPLHTAVFNPSEQAMLVGVRLFHELARHLAGSHR